MSGSKWYGWLAIAVAAFGFSAGAPAQEGWKNEWSKVLDGARKEGMVVVYGPPGPFQREAIVSGWQRRSFALLPGGSVGISTIVPSPANFQP